VAQPIGLKFQGADVFARQGRNRLTSVATQRRVMGVCVGPWYPDGPKDLGENLTWNHMVVSLNGGTQPPWVFLLKMIILGRLGYHHFRKPPYGHMVEKIWFFIHVHLI